MLCEGRLQSNLAGKVPYVCRQLDCKDNPSIVKIFRVCWDELQEFRIIMSRNESNLDEQYPRKVIKPFL